MPRFTPETARENAIKGNKVRWSPKPVPEPTAIEPRIAETVAQTDSHARTRLDRVRLQLDRIDDLMLTEDDPAKLDRLASAQARLAEQERILAGRPLPGSYRPMSDKPKRSNRAVEVWSEPATPQPVVSSVPPQAPVQPPSTPPVYGPENG